MQLTLDGVFDFPLIDDTTRRGRRKPSLRVEFLERTLGDEYHDGTRPLSGSASASVSRTPKTLWIGGRRVLRVRVALRSESLIDCASGVVAFSAAMR